MITRIVITLVVAMIICFVFHKKLMDFFRYPVDKVLITQVENTLPDEAPRPPTVETWGQARKVEYAASAMSLEERERFYNSLADEDLVFHSKSISFVRAASLVPEKNQQAFVKSLDATDEMKLQVTELLKTKPSTDTDLKGNQRMMSALKPTEPFMLSMKLSFVAGIVVSFPLLLMFVLQFVLPGLHSHERRVLWPSMAVGFGLFLVGTAFAYFLVLPRALQFFYLWGGDMGISNDWRIGEYISFATQFTLLFGLSFELPVVVMVLVKLGLLSYETMSNTRSYAVVGIFVAAMILTPTPDAFTMLLMATPMIILYEICIWLAYFDAKKNRQKEEEEARERIERQLAREEEMRAAAALSASEAGDDEKGWHDEHDQIEHHADEAGDDGWHEEYDQQDPHGETPDPDNTPTPSLPEDEERKRMS